MSGEEWTADEQKVRRYLDRADEFPHRLEGEAVLLEHVPADARRILDLGTGDGRLLTLLRADRPEMSGCGLDFSELMLASAQKRSPDDKQTQFIKHDLAEQLPALGKFDAVVSSFAIHHLEHDRKRSLYGEVFDLLEPGGVFANFEHVASATERLHLAFFEAIEEPSRMRNRLIVCSTSRHSSDGCTSSALMTSIAIGSGLRWRFLSASGQPLLTSQLYDAPGGD